jgi:hypothetical protein
VKNTIETFDVDYDQKEALVSIAISLKRIADALTEPVNEYGEPMTQAIPGEIRRGMRDFR